MNSSTPAPGPANAFSRRAGLTLAATSAVGGAAAVLTAGPMAQAAPPGPRSMVPRPGDTAFIKVSAATVWVSPRLNRRGTDDPSLSVPVHLGAWNRNLAGTEARRWLTGKLETQGVLGSHVIVDRIDGAWAKVVLTHQPTPRDKRGYPGWVPLAQLVKDSGFAVLAGTRPTARVTALRSRLTGTPSGGRPGIEVSFDTILPVLGRTGKAVRVAVPGGGAQYLPAADVVVRTAGQAIPTPTVEDVIATGERFLGLRYLWAGVSSWGFDCSGFTFTLFHHYGITIPRDAGPQLKDSGYPRVERKDLRRGDLVFFASKPGGSSTRHVAVYLGGDRILHAPNASRNVEIVSLSGYDPKGDYAGAVRVLQR